MEVVLWVLPVIVVMLAGVATWSFSGRRVRTAARSRCPDNDDYGRFRLRRTLAVMIAVSICGTALSVAWVYGCLVLVFSCVVTIAVIAVSWCRLAVKRHVAKVIAAAVALDINGLERVLVEGRLRFGLLRYERCYRTVFRSFIAAGCLSCEQAVVLDMLAVMDRASACKVADEAVRDYVKEGLSYAEDRDLVDSLLHVTGAYLSPEVCYALARIKASHFETEELWPISLSDAVADGRPCYYRHRVAVVPIAVCGGRRTADADCAELVDLYIFNNAIETVSKNSRTFMMQDIIKIRQIESSCLSMIFRKSCEPLVIVSEEAMVIGVIVEKLRRRKMSASESASYRAYSPNLRLSQRGNIIAPMAK